MRGDKIALAGLVCAVVFAVVGLTNEHLFTVHQGAGQVASVGQRTADTMLARLALRRWLRCERDSGFWFRTMNECLGDLSTACFDPTYCDEVRAAASEAEKRGER